MKKLVILISLIFIPAVAIGELTISLDGGVSGITSNSVIDIDHDSSAIWLGTGAGASVSIDEGQTWTTFGPETFPSGEVSALTANNRAVWVAISHSEAAAGEAYPFGDGVAITRDGGQTWSIFQPSQIHFYGMIAYDLSVYDTMAFASCFYGGLIRSTDFGQTWQNLFATQLDSINADSADFHAQNYSSLRNRFFSVKADTTEFPNTFSVWAGSAKGISRFFFYTDSLSSAFHTYPDSIEQIYYIYGDTTIDDTLQLPGNHVVALGINKVDTIKYVWAACRPVSTGEARRVGYSIDNGQTWHEVAITDPAGNDDVEAWDFAFSNDTVYVATSFGLYISYGDYRTWTLLSGFRDPERQAFYQDNAAFYAADIVDGTVWAGGADGAVKSVTGGWDVFRSQRNATEHFAYPSPFSPQISTRQGSTIHFLPSENTRATVKIFDFNMELVKTVASNVSRLGGVESDDIVWDGTNDKGKTVANGVYFYQIQLDYGDDLWGKVVVIK